MVYDKQTPGWGRDDTRRACLIGKGNCTDFHSLFISMARAERIPARFKIGVQIPPEPSGRLSGYHCWAECYLAGEGWLTVDAAEGSKHPERRGAYFGWGEPDRFLISAGRHLELVPRQRGEPVNLFFYPYAEADGREFRSVETVVEFLDRQP